MSNEILNFSVLIDQHFEYTDEPAGGFLSFLINLFR